MGEMDKKNEPLRMGFGGDEQTFFLSCSHHRDLKPSRRGFFYWAVLAALAMNPFGVAAKTTDIVLGAEVRSPGAEPKKARRLVSSSSRGAYGIQSVA